MHAATQNRQGTIVALAAAMPQRAVTAAVDAAPRGSAVPAADTMSPAKPRLFKIQGITREGKAFRPSDWAERLAGAMSCFRPGGSAGGIGSFIGYSPYCVPRLIDGVKNVIVDPRLKGLEPMAWDFVMNFARDNALKVVEGRLLPDGTFEAAPKAE